MKIGNVDHSKPVTPAGGQATAPAGDKLQGASAAQPEASTKVALSPAAQRINEANADFDAEKVSRIAQAIRDGQFTVNAEAIADKLISNAQELLSGRQH